jgi:hypothetical protein
VSTAQRVEMIRDDEEHGEHGTTSRDDQMRLPTTGQGELIELRRRESVAVIEDVFITRPS